MLVAESPSIFTSPSLAATMPRLNASSDALAIAASMGFRDTCFSCSISTASMRSTNFWKR